MSKVFYADCDQFDNHQTGFHATSEEAEKAFAEETALWLSEDERARVAVYTCAEDSGDPDVVEMAEYQAANGSPSPALGFRIGC